MKALVISASRYGSTTETAQWITQRLQLAGIESACVNAADAPAPTDEDMIILGSGLYAHKLLDEVDSYIDKHLEALSQKKVSLFALAMRTTPIFVRGQAHGGLSQLSYLFKKLGAAVVHAEMLGGQMAFDQLNEADAAGLEKFYAMLKLPADEIARRKAPRTLMNKADYWAFAETAIAKSRS